MPTCWIIAGPNGAGKTTFALDYLPKTAECTNFINADLIAAGLSPLAPARELLTASRIFLREVEERIAEGENFAFETTLSGRGHLKRINQLKRFGWQTELIYLGLPDVEMSKMRVAERVSHGGHDIPIKDIERRFPRSLHNLLTEYCSAVNHCLCFMNHGDNPVPIFEQRGEVRDIFHRDFFDLLSQEAGL
ncbi:MAG: hypothetical protein HN366_05650 [Deltaproteobacteria bacterium]|jgi:predicted ABC-type ATPase|nr:hypothetical protein [Deltaproteobacteria bacterium]